MARTSRTGTRTDLALLGVALACALAALVLPTTVRERVQGSLRSSVVAPLVSAQAWAERGRSAISDHGRLLTRVDSLALAAQSVDPLKAENERLRAVIGLGQRLGWGFVATEILHPPHGGEEHEVLLATGSAAGVRAFSPLVVPEGLVGMVTKAEANSSTAILWTHPDFRVSATTTDGAAFGIVAAHLGSGADRYLLEMRGVPFRSELKAGTLIVSSGLGNVFPRGIPIGVVLRETKTIEGWARTYLIRPIVSPDQATAAVVLLPPRAAAGVDGAWSSASATEATQKAIVAAGDSLIADSVRVVQERLAKLALLDSLRRAAIYRGDSGVRVEGDSAPAPHIPATAPPAAIPAPAVAPPSTPAPKPAATPAPKPVADSSALRALPPTARPTTPRAPTGTGGPSASPVGTSTPRRSVTPPATATSTPPRSTGTPAPAATPAATRPRPLAASSGGAARADSAGARNASTRRPATSAAPTVRRDTAAARPAAPRPRPVTTGAGTTTAPRRPRPSTADSAAARNRSKPKPKPPENPFRLPAGRGAA